MTQVSSPFVLTVRDHLMNLPAWKDKSEQEILDTAERLARQSAEIESNALARGATPEQAQEEADEVWMRA